MTKELRITLSERDYKVIEELATQNGRTFREEFSEDLRIGVGIQKEIAAGKKLLIQERGRITGRLKRQELVLVRPLR